MTELFSKKTIVLPALAMIVATLLLTQPAQMWAQSTVTPGASGEITAAAFPTIASCTLDQQPLNGIDMNTVNHNSKVKTIHVEKEFLKCLDSTTAQPILVLLSIYTEIFEDVNSTLAPAKKFVVETCAKTLDGNILGCKTAIPPTAFPLVPTQCTTQTLPFPLRMNTVVATGPATSPNVAETVEAEKEVFKCNPDPAGGPTVVKDVTIFTKILEDIDTGKTLSTKFVFATCIKDIKSAFVACK